MKRAFDQKVRSVDERTEMDRMPARVITIVVHGTFAADATWWRLGENDKETFAGRLEIALARRGVFQTVWQPALEMGLDYGAFAWSGKNKHKDRIIGARKLRLALASIAQKIGATRQAPLVVNFVAHSHGGNVVLEALRRLGDNVRVGRILFLGTPLISVRPAFRLFRFVVSYLLLTIVTLSMLFILLKLAGFILPENFLYETMSLVDKVLLMTVPIIAFYGWLFWLIASLGDLGWRILCSPVMWLQGRAAGQTYGPSTHALTKMLSGHAILLFTSHEDEAGLLLQLGLAPQKLYQKQVDIKHNLLGRVFERIFIRPIVVGIFFKVLQLFLERTVLGFSWFRVLFFEYKLSPIDEQPYYPSELLKRVDVTAEPQSALQRLRTANISPAPVSVPEDVKGTERHVAALDSTMKEVVSDIISQIQLRHSLYYESEAVLERVAEALVDRVGDITVTTNPIL